MLRYACSGLALVKHIVDQLQRSVQLTVRRPCVSMMSGVACMQRHDGADAVYVGSFVVCGVQIGATQPMLIPPSL